MSKKKFYFFLVSFLALLFFNVFFVSGTAPVMKNATINTTLSNSVAYANDTLLGWCNASDADADNITYYYNWYLNNVLNESNGVVPYDIFKSENYWDGGQGFSPSVNYQYCLRSAISHNGYLNDFNVTVRISAVSGDVIVFGIWKGNSTTPLNSLFNSSNVSGFSVNSDYVYSNSSIIYIDSYYLYGCVKWLGGAMSSVRGGGYGAGYWTYFDTINWVGSANYSLAVKNFTFSISSINPGVMTNVVNVSSSSLVKGQNWTFSCLANDGTSNSSWLNSSVLTISNLAPYPPTGLKPNSSSFYTNDATPLLNASVRDEDGDSMNLTFYNSSGLALCTALNVVNGSVGECNTSALTDSTFVYWAGSYDGTSYSSNSSNATFIIDLTSPSFVVVYPSSHNTTINSTVYVNVTASDGGSGLGSCFYRIFNYTDNSSLQNGTLNCSGQNLAFPVGILNVNLTVNDTVGNWNNTWIANFSTVTDTSNPIVTISSPSSSFQGLGFTLSGTVTDNVGVSSCWYVFNVSVHADDTPSSNTSMSCAGGTFSVAESTNTFGDHMIIVYSEDTTGNVGMSSQRFTNSPVSSSTGGGGGGGVSTIILVGVNETTFTLSTVEGSGSLDLIVMRGSQRTKGFLIRNVGLEQATFKVSCVSEGVVCSWINFSSKEFQLVAGEEAGFDMVIRTPLEGVLQGDIFNFLIRVRGGGLFADLPVVVLVNDVQGFILGLWDKLFSSVELGGVEMTGFGESVSSGALPILIPVLLIVSVFFVGSTILFFLLTKRFPLVFHQVSTWVLPTVLTFFLLIII